MIGRRVDRYRIVSELGRGGMGTVWKAQDERLGRAVALKLLTEDLALSTSARRRFEREARAASRLDHPAIAAVHDSGEHGGRLYIVTALVDGCTVRERLRDGPMALSQALRIAEEVAGALQHAHDRGVLHRDISSGNVMVGRNGRVQVIDFGLARLRKDGSSRLTPSGAMWGTGSYIAPEVIRDQEAGPRGDLYSLGVLLYEMLTGAAPFEGEVPEAMVHRILNEMPAPPSSRRLDVPPKLDRLVLKALAKEPMRRYASAGAMLRDLQALGLSGPAAPERRSVPVRRRSAIERPAEAPRFLAVLPFRDESAGRRRPHALVFARGLAETVSARLARVPGVRVIPPFALPARAGSRTDLETLAREVGASLVLGGSVQRVGQQIRVTFSLVGPRRVQVAGDTIDGTMRDILLFEDLLVRRIATALEIETATIPSPKDGPDPAAHERYVQALGYLQRYENEASVDGAIHILEKLAHGGGRDARVEAALGRAYLAKFMLTMEPDWEKRASEACREALELDPDAPEVLAVLGHVHRVKGRYVEAIQCYRRALSMRPDDPDVLCHLAWAYQHSGEMAQAEQALRAALTLRPLHWSTHNMLGVLLFHLGRYEEAAAAWSRVIELSPDNARGYYNLGAARYHQGRFAEAAAAYERSLEIRPDASAYSSLGTMYFSLGDFARAVDAMEKSRNLRPSDPRVWGNLADAYRWMPGSEERAASAFDRAIALRREQLRTNRNHGRQWAELANWLAKRGKMQQARRALGRAMELMPADLLCMTHAVLVHHLAGDRAEALRWLQAAVRQGCDVAELERDPELAELRRAPEFGRIVQEERSVKPQGKA
jgi:tetratricopeptide (TPR) repeat protein/TolB-like protein